MNDENSTIGVSKLPSQTVHHTFWYYKVGKKCNLLERIYCNEHCTSYPTSDAMREQHPQPEYMIAKTIKHVFQSRIR